MGHGCLSKGSVKIQEMGFRATSLNSSNPGNNAELIRRKKSQLFLTDDSESTFVELSTPRTGRLIRWKRGEIIGEGAYAKVYQCMNIETGELLAVKHFQLTDDPTKIQKDFTLMKKEVSLLKQLDHPNIVQYYQTDLSPEMNSLDVVIEYVPGGTLRHLIQKYGILEDNVIKTFARQLLKGLAYLHENNVIHRDLKSANILISTNGKLKLTDFGSSRKFEHSDLELTKSLRGSPYWMAPEVVLRRGHSYSADIWSLGCVLIEMASGRPPWSNYSKDAREVLKLIATNEMLPDFPKCENQLKNIIKQCIQRDPMRRPSAKDLLKLSYFHEKNPESIPEHSHIHRDISIHIIEEQAEE
ncbi:unnamed protein product [Blepharisma stoltei]|uniref:Protein kinase domain-containing protein n=1 Tax=Blepharisma stoltei TaxID=1481888 RepID=A0AAU9IPU0_9CILI|nr:unnamed protein product [Blepharisma stoltei]